jgi:predicted histone-like DNA-binding protein
MVFEIFMGKQVKIKKYKIMAVKYIPAAKIDPADPEKPPMYYAKPKGGNKIQFEEIVELIIKISNLNYGQVLGALGSFMEVIEMELKQGREVELSSIGTFFLTLQSEGVNEPDELRAEHIKRARIRFRPGKRLKKMTSKLDYIKSQ